MNYLGKHTLYDPYSRDFIGCIRSLLTIGLLYLLSSMSLRAQDLNGGLGSLSFGTIEGVFVGPSFGFETGFGDHFTLEIGAHLGFAPIGKSITARPSVKYYVHENHRGFFLGPTLKFIRLEEQNGEVRFDDALFAIGFTTGVKAFVTDNIGLMFDLNPHLTLGGNGESHVAGMGFQFGLSYRLAKH